MRGNAPKRILGPFTALLRINQYLPSGTDRKSLQLARNAPQCPRSIFCTMGESEKYPFCALLRGNVRKAPIAYNITRQRYLFCSISANSERLTSYGTNTEILLSIM
jgi:hypothetical protein